MITDRAYRQEDYPNIIAFLQHQYLQNKDENSWLAQRWEDMEYRVNVLHTQERNKPSWHNKIHLWEEDGSIVAICNSEGGNEAWMHITNGYETLFPLMLDWAEQNIPAKGESLSVFATASQTFKEKELASRNYTKLTDKEQYSFFKKIKCDKTYDISLPDGFSIISGTQELKHTIVSFACECGFHPDKENEECPKVLAPSWKSRETAPMFDYQYEVVAQDKHGEIASYSYVWVDKTTNTGYIEPVSTREKFRRKGLGRAIQLATINLLHKNGVEYCFVNPYGETRDKFYSSCGYETFDYEYEWKKQF